MKVTIKPIYPRILPDRDEVKNWYVDEPFTLAVTFDTGKTLNINMSKGYRFDGHSVPWLSSLFFPKAAGPDLYASMAHDVVIDYEQNLRLTRRDQWDIYTYLMRETPAYKTNDYRSKWMPKAVAVNDYLSYTIWGDYRGDMKQHTELTIKLETQDVQTTDSKQ